VRGEIKEDILIVVVTINRLDERFLVGKYSTGHEAGNLHVSYSRLI
jgi:hypothetical protein